MKIFKISFLACFFTFALNAADNTNDDTYVFEAKGEFAKELKSLIEKHSKDENITVNIYKSASTAGGKANIGKVNRNINSLKERGGAIFAEKCASCHGENGQKKAYGVSRKLKDLDAKEISIAISQYTTDLSYGGKMKNIMQLIAAKTSATIHSSTIAHLAEVRIPKFPLPLVSRAHT